MTCDGKPEARKIQFTVIAKAISLTAGTYELEQAIELARNLSTIPIECEIFDDTGKLIRSFLRQEGEADAPAPEREDSEVIGVGLEDRDIDFEGLEEKYPGDTTELTWKAKKKKRAAAMADGLGITYDPAVMDGKDETRSERQPTEEPQGAETIDVGLISPEGIDNVVSLLPALKSIPPGEIADWSGGYMEPEYHRTVQGVMDALNGNHFVQPFDWPKWQPTAMKIYKEPTRLSKATLKTCVKLTTLHVRKDRFCGGHFGAMVASGHIIAILERVAALRESAERRQEKSFQAIWKTMDLDKD